MSWDLSAEEGRGGPVAPYVHGLSQLLIEQDLMLLGWQADGLNYCLDLMVAAETEFFDSLYTQLLQGTSIKQ
jgi:hypothetical protein